MKISKTHQRFTDDLDDQRALDQPEEFLGPNWKEVLNFWLYLDTLSPEQFDIAIRRFWAFDLNDRISLRNLIWNASCDIVGENNILRSYRATYAGVDAFATIELIGVHKIFEQGKPLTFVPIFLNL